MVDYTEPPVVSDAELANLTYEQLAQLINEGNPNDFYLEASAFDEATGRLQQLRDDFLRESRLLQGFVSGEILLAVEEVTRRHVGLIDSVLEPMLSPGYAQALRKAGDALANGQQRLRDLQAQNGQQDPAVSPEQSEQTRLQALQILRDIGTAYRDIGGTFGSLPDLPNSGNQSFGGPTVTNGQGPGNTPLLFVGGRCRSENTPFLSQDVDSGPSEVRTNGGNVFAGDAPGPFAGGAPVVGSAFAAALGRTADGPLGTVGEVRLSRAGDESVKGAPAVAAGVLSSGVLGRSSARTIVTGNGRKENKREKDTATEDEAVLAMLREEERPETVSTAVPEARIELTQQKAVATVSAEVPKIQTASVPAFDVRAELGQTAVEGTVDPKERGMQAPATSGTELSAGQPLPMITPMAVPMPQAGSPAQAGTSASGQGMGPMMPPMMMGGMRGGAGGQDGERFADVPVTPEAEVWDPSRATGTVLGRPDPEPSEPPEPCSEQEIDAVRQAAIDEILGKRS